jgi:hypothetical protein
VAAANGLVAQTGVMMAVVAAVAALAL